MIVSILIWISIVLGSIFLLLLIVPFRISLSGSADDREGLGYKLVLCWAFGFITVIAVQGEPITILLFGFRVWSLSSFPFKNKSGDFFVDRSQRFGGN